MAFTDVVKDAKDGQEYTEAKMNGFPEAATGDIEKRMNDEAGHFVRPFFILHPSTLLPAADLEAFAKEAFNAKRSVEKLQGVVKRKGRLFTLTH